MESCQCEEVHHPETRANRVEQRCIAARKCLRTHFLLQSSRFTTHLPPRQKDEAALDDSSALQRFMTGDMTVFTASQFHQFGGGTALARFEQRGEVFEALRQSTPVRQSLLAAVPGES